MKTILNKQQEVKERIKLWLSYQNYLESYYRLLKAKYESEQERLQAPTITVINQIKQGTYLVATQNEELRHLLEKIHDINRRLISYSDTTTQTVLETEWNDLQKSVNEIDINIKQRSDALVTVRIYFYKIFLIDRHRFILISFFNSSIERLLKGRR
jgi:hypothetical protein